MSWLQIKKIIILKCHRFLFYATTTNHFSIGIVTCNEKWTAYSNQQWPAQWLDWEEAPKHLPKPNLRQKKVMVTVWWPAAGLIHCSFLNPGETIISEKYAQQINEMHRKRQRLHPALVNSKSPTLLHNNTQSHVAQPTLQKLNKLDYEILLASSAIFTWSLNNQVARL